MKQLIFLLSFFSCVSQNLIAQENESAYADTVDIVDFIEAIYLQTAEFRDISYDEQENKFDTAYVLKNVTIISKVELVKPDTFSHEVFERFKLRHPESDSVIELKYNLRITDCNIHRKGQYARYSYYYGHNDGLAFKNFNFKKVTIQGVNSSNIAERSSKLSFFNCSFSSLLSKSATYLRCKRITAYFYDCYFNGNTRIGIEDNITLATCKTFGKMGVSSMGGNVSITNTTFESNQLDTLVHTINDSNLLRRHGNEILLSDGVRSIAQLFSSLSIQKQQKLNGVFKTIKNLLTISIGGSNRSGEAPKLEIHECDFIDSAKNSNILIKADVQSLHFNNNTLNSRLYFDKSKIHDDFEIKNNRGIQNLIIDEVQFSEFKNHIKWSDISGIKLSSIEPNSGIINSVYYNSHSGVADSLFSREDQYNRLIEVYVFLYNNYKKQGNTRSANGCYAEMKQIETRRWEHLYKQNKSFESFFRWQLNSFLSYFTDYGTNPAKAVVKSGWVILLFSIFYLFFPSDWDVSNRSQLLSKIKDLTSKNREKTFVATLAFVSYSAFIHILNALTLSLNAFTTLGFGDIPTHGAARYVTIVQGFIGWFLLTIFSVTLINQVLG